MPIHKRINNYREVRVERDFEHPVEIETTREVPIEVEREVRVPMEYESINI